MMIRICKLLRIFCRNTHGVALIEFAFVFPIIMLILLGGLETARAMVITQRVEKVAYALADVTSQYTPATSDRAPGELSETELLTNVFPQLGRIMGVYANDARQVMILTSVRQEAGVRRIKWQIAGGGSLNRNVASVVNGLAPSAITEGVKMQVANFAGDADVLAQVNQMVEGENLIVAEVFYQYEPIWSQVVGAVGKAEGTGEEATIAHPKLLVKRMYFRPRSGDLTCLPERFLYSDCGLPTPPTPPGPTPPVGPTHLCNSDEAFGNGTNTGSCYIQGGQYSGAPCGPCASNGSHWQSIGGGCRRFKCDNGIIRDVGAGQHCEFAASCTIGDN